MIQMLDLHAQYEEIKPEIKAAVMDVLERGVYILGPNVKTFEDELAAYLGVERTVGLASGTDALRLALDTLGVGAGDEVITTSFSFIATANTISRAGAKPVFADIDPMTFNLDPKAVERCITPQTKGIIVVHLYGQPADMGALLDVAERHNLWLLEDACQALGATWHERPVGTLGIAGCFSFYPTKNLGAAGDAGLLCSNDSAFVEQVRVLARHGGLTRYQADTVGYNSRLDEIQAAILRVKLPCLDRWNALRRHVATCYSTLLNDTPVSTPCEVPGTTHVFHQYTVRAPHRNDLAATLAAAGIATMVYYPMPIHLQPLYSDFGYMLGDLPEAERASQEVLSLPIYPEIKVADILHITNVIRRFYGCG